jgi:hypothetical protein
MYSIGSFDPLVYKYINIRYRVVSGTAGSTQIFFTNNTYTIGDGAAYTNGTLISDTNWHTQSIDMSKNANWATGGNITGWRYDFATVSGVTMELDFIELSSQPILGTGTTITVSPTTNTSYYVNRKGPETNTSCISQLVTVNQIPTISNFNNYSKTYFDGSFTIANPTSDSAGSFSYTSDNASVATISGNTVTITGIGTANITATQAANGSLCSNTATVSLTVNDVAVVTKNGEITSVYSNYVNHNGQKGGETGVTKNGKIKQTLFKKDGLTTAKAGSSALQIKQDFPLSVNGIYWITNPNINGGIPFQIYADMTTDGGGWMLLNISGNSNPTLSETVTSLTDRKYLPRATVIELANLCTDVQLRSGSSASSYYKTTSTSPLAIGALRSNATEVNGAGTWANGASSTFVVNSGSWLWAYCCPGAAVGWPKMYHSSNFATGVHWFADGGIGTGRRNSSPDAWFSTWIR